MRTPYRTENFRSGGGTRRSGCGDRNGSTIRLAPGKRSSKVDCPSQQRSTPRSGIPVRKRREQQNLAGARPADELERLLVTGEAQPVADQRARVEQPVAEQRDHLPPGARGRGA